MPLKNALNTAALQRPRPRELLEAARRNDMQAVKDLLQRGADVNDRSQLGDTPLIWAAWLENRDNVLLLLKHGADIDARNDLNLTAMDYLIRDGKVEMAALLDKAIEQRAEAKGQAQQMRAKGQAQAQAKRAERNRRLHDTAAERQERLRGRAPKLIIKHAL